MGPVPSVLIVGASRGIGLELARQYAADGWRVHATTRTPDEPGALGQLAGDVVLHGLDVRDAAGIQALARALDGEGLDVLVHNAGVRGTGMAREEVMRVNAEAPIAVAQALLGALARGGQRKLVLMSSQLGARRGSRRSLGVYGDSKAALNDALRRLAPTWGRLSIVAVVMHPGWVRTDMGGPGAPLSARESVEGIRRVVAGLGPEHHGRFLTWDGSEHPW